ncbi:sulfotransferase domain-containing protein [Marinococcus halotolerans]|uniref:sulfotransferase domain-containing protein n=1 Tax=Marinococcus halotolerans TaxID=301092 RepID=UPI0003B3CD65|nr:sulfotransferase domain-containing protein [Marinococcus halotolerans]
MKIKKSVFFRKTNKVIMKFKKNIIIGNKKGEGSVIVNSFPKSGTHLLLQVIQKFPNVNYQHDFIASQPSLTFKELNNWKINKKIENITDHEVVPAHLMFNSGFEEIIKKKNIVHFFIYRDLRDVVISEAYYLSKMNKWHKLNKYFKNLSMDEAISLAINGLDEKGIYYPDIGTRFERYKEWINRSNTFSLRYEDLISSNKHDTIEKMLIYYCEKNNINFDSNYVTKALENINPAKSHTFRKGEKNSWKNNFSERNKRDMKKQAGELLIELKMEKDLKW